MKYNWKIIDDRIAKALNDNYNVYVVMFEANTKLAFVKQLKEDAGLGLKEAKENADIVFDGGITMFRETFGIKRIRRNKLDALKKRLLVNELVEYIKKTDQDKMEEVFSEMKIEIVEEILNNFLEYD